MKTIFKQFRCITFVKTKIEKFIVPPDLQTFPAFPEGLGTGRTSRLGAMGEF
jgi:hypothetical protein